MAHRRSVLALVSVATPISRAAGALTWLTNHLENRTRGKSSPPRKRRRRRRPSKSRRGRQRSRNRSASKAETVGSRMPTNPGSPHTEQAIVGRVSELRTGDGAPPSPDAPRIRLFESNHPPLRKTRRNGPHRNDHPAAESLSDCSRNGAPEQVQAESRFQRSKTGQTEIK